MAVHGGVQGGHERFELFQELGRVVRHRGVEAVGERAEELVRPFLDVPAAAQRDDAPVGVLAGTGDVPRRFETVQERGGGARGQGDPLAQPRR